jgi:predicted RNA-binding protein YlxR (DUF448 family)/ribosomal protein L7Ae-like RNA K-turn-binding protein
MSERRGAGEKPASPHSSVQLPAARLDSSTEPSESSETNSERLCVGCRRTDSREELLRFAIGPDAPYLAPDLQRKLGGRGVSVHPTRACMELAMKRGGFARALKRDITRDGKIDVDALCGSAAMLYEKRAESLLIAAARRRKLAIGTDSVREALRSSIRNEGERSPVFVETLVVSKDAEGRREELEALAERLGRHCVVLGTKNSLGRLFGRDEVGVLGILDRGIADEVVRCAAHAAELKSPEGSEPEGKDGQCQGGATVRVSEAE